MSARKYWSIQSLLSDWLYNRKFEQDNAKQMRAKASWLFFRRRCGVPDGAVFDQHVMRVIEGR